MSAVIAVFARPPIAGRAKTRLAPSLGAEAAAELARAFLSDTIEACRRAQSALGAIELSIELWSAGDVDHPDLVELARGASATVFPQPGGDLGVRMTAALDAATRRGVKALVVGSDAPTLPARYLAAALTALDAADLVLGPAADGGYWLIGARAPLPDALLAGVRWSSASTRAETVARAHTAGLHVASLPPWYDVDDSDDLRVLAAHLALDPAAAPATARALASWSVS